MSEINEEDISCDRMMEKVAFIKGIPIEQLRLQMAGEEKENQGIISKKENSTKRTSKLMENVSRIKSSVNSSGFQASIEREKKEKEGKKKKMVEQKKKSACVGLPNNAFRNEMATLLYAQFNSELEFGSSIPGTKCRINPASNRRASHANVGKGKPERPKVPRFMRKNGHCNIRQAAQDKRERYMSDLFTTFVDLDWMYSIALFIGFYAIIWVIFSFLYWVVAFARGDLAYWKAQQMFMDKFVKMAKINETDKINFMQVARDRRVATVVLNALNAGGAFAGKFEKYRKILSNLIYYPAQAHKPCFQHVHSYATAFLFFIETETTVGYGTRTITDNCPEAILLLVFQCLLGTLVDAVLVGCIFIKISKPKNRTDTLIFSEKAVIAQRDGKFGFMFRVGNLRNSLIVQCKIRAKFVRSRHTEEGEFIALDQTDINIGFDTGADKLFLVTPLIVFHEINEKSPFWDLSEADIYNDPFEIIVILEGTVESTGMICQARTSYLNREIQWGYRFMPMLFLDRHHFSADHSMFHSTYEVRMPVYSAKQVLNQSGEKEGDQRKSGNRKTGRMAIGCDSGSCNSGGNNKIKSIDNIAAQEI